jgi:hypothetical protein
MRGPFLPGTLRSPTLDNEGEQLEFGRRYRVVKPFVDDDRGQHPEGEEWTFIGSYFVPYDEMLFILIRMPDDMEWTIPLVWNENGQLDVCSNLHKFVQPINPTVERC